MVLYVAVQDRPFGGFHEWWSPLAGCLGKSHENVDDEMTGWWFNGDLMGFNGIFWDLNPLETGESIAGWW